MLLATGDSVLVLLSTRAIRHPEAASGRDRGAIVRGRAPAGATAATGGVALVHIDAGQAVLHADGVSILVLVGCENPIKAVTERLCVGRTGYRESRHGVRDSTTKTIAVSASFRQR